MYDSTPKQIRSKNDETQCHNCVTVKYYGTIGNRWATHFLKKG